MLLDIWKKFVLLTGTSGMTASTLGYAIAPRHPGHGVEFDWRSLEKIKP